MCFTVGLASGRPALRAGLSAFTVAAILIATACSHIQDGAWTTSFPTAGPHRSDAPGCNFSHPRHHPPPDAPPLTESEARHYVAVLIDGPRCATPAERRRIARDTAALRMYVDLLSDRQRHFSFDVTEALAWLASSENPRPYLRTFLSFAIVDTSYTGVPALLTRPAVTGLLRLAPESAAARDRLRELARHGGREQRALFLDLLVEINDSTARAVLNEEGAGLIAGWNPPDRRARDIAAVLAAPAATPEVRGPCGYERRMGRASSGAYGCVEPVPGARLLLRFPRYMPVARFEAKRTSRTSPRDQLEVSIRGPGFLRSDAVVSVEHATDPSKGETTVPMVPDTILAHIGGDRGESLTTLVQDGPLVIPAIAFGAGGGSLRLQRVGDGGPPFELVVMSEVRLLEREPSVGRLRLTRSDADRFIRTLREAAVEAKRQDAAGVERIMTGADTLARR